MHPISIIIPVFGVQNFIEKNTRSLMEQTLDDIEYIFVDDCSLDDSINVLERTLTEYPKRCCQCKIIRHQRNRGLPAARNTGLLAASGEYIYHCDSDDWLDSDMMESLYCTAKQSDADLVWCDFLISLSQNERKMAARDYSSSDELVRKGFLSGDMKYNVWNKLVKRSLYVENSINFPDGHSMGEDMTMIKLAACAKKVAYVPKALYHYVKTNPGAYTQTMSEKNLSDIRYNVDDLCHWMESYFPGEYSLELNFFKQNVKLPFLISDDFCQYQLWKEWYPESNSSIFKNRQLPLRTKLLEYMASQNMWWYVRMYYRFIYKFIYGTLYK